MCAPQSFEAIKDPSTQKIWIGPEYNPNAYEKRYDGDGVYYVAKPEFTAEQEEIVSREATDEKEKRLRAEEEKRKYRRTLPMDEAELRQAINLGAEFARRMREN